MLSELQDPAERWRTVWIRWEILRLVFNGLLFGWGMFLLYRLWDFEVASRHVTRRLHDDALGLAVVGMVVLANVSFCLGPLIETGLFAFRKPHPIGVRAIVFAALVLAWAGLFGMLSHRAWLHIASYR